MRVVLSLGVLILTVAIGVAADPPKAPANRLAQEASPYLRQHAQNPVDWHPWGPEAFAKAKKEKKLIFLSIGYSACHWCHVMERESFANQSVADIMNKSFVCIKVDREERPDIDDVYMTAMQLMDEASGWPLSVFLTVDGKPIFGGSYFPPEDVERDGQKVTGFKSVLKRVADLNAEKPEELQKQAERVSQLTAEVLERNARIAGLVPLNKDLVEDSVAGFAIDSEHGGLGSRSRQFQGAKFPQVPAMLFLLRQSTKPGREALGKGIAMSLEKMAAGGIFDHLGGGFHRYSTERTWTVPHFEKMLYDQAQLVELFSEAHKLKANPLYERAIRESLAFVARELTSPEGAFFSALDADTDGVEGATYVWKAKELDAILGTGDDAKLFREVYSANQPNFEEKYSILRLSKPLVETAEKRKTTEAELLKTLAPMKEKLLAAREKKAKPFLDQKVLTGWNGQMIAAYAKAGEVLKEPTYLQTAEKAADFLLLKMKQSDGRLVRMYAAKPGEASAARGMAFLEDYAFFIHGLLNLHEATKNPKWLKEAHQFAVLMVKWHGDSDRGGFFTTASDQEKLFVRGKDYHDSAQPSGNGTAARDLLRLSVLVNEPKFRETAEKAVQALAPIMRSSPTAVPVSADVLDRLLETAPKP